MTASPTIRHSPLLHPATALVAAVLLTASPAHADDPIAEVLQKGTAEWSDGFDAAASTAPDVRTSTPILSAEIVGALEYAKITQIRFWGLRLSALSAPRGRSPSYSIVTAEFSPSFGGVQGVLPLRWIRRLS